MITVQEETTRNPITLIGKEAGICYNSNTKDDDKNYKRGLGCINSGHGRTLEYPQVYLIIDGYSAKVIRELYTHIGGLPTRLQASTRYIDYNKDMFQYVTPPSIQRSELTSKIYYKCMGYIHKAVEELERLGVPREDSSFLMPLGMTTKIVFRTDLRLLVDMSHQRLCNRALWEYQKLMHDIMKALSEYSDEWKEIVNKLFVPKCDVLGYCPEAKSCGRKPKLKRRNAVIRATFGALDKLKDNKGILVYEGDSVKEASQAEREFVENMGMQFGVPTGNGSYVTRVIDDKENKRRFIDFGSHTLFIMERFEDIYSR